MTKILEEHIDSPDSEQRVDSSTLARYASLFTQEAKKVIARIPDSSFTDTVSTHLEKLQTDLNKRDKITTLDDINARISEFIDTIQSALMSSDHIYRLIWTFVQNREVLKENMNPAVLQNDTGQKEKGSPEHIDNEKVGKMVRAVGIYRNILRGIKQKKLPLTVAGIGYITTAFEGITKSVTSDVTVIAAATLGVFTFFSSLIIKSLMDKKSKASVSLDNFLTGLNQFSNIAPETTPSAMNILEQLKELISVDDPKLREDLGKQLTEAVLDLVNQFTAPSELDRNNLFATNMAMQQSLNSLTASVSSSLSAGSKQLIIDSSNAILALTGFRGGDPVSGALLIAGFFGLTTYLEGKIAELDSPLLLEQIRLAESNLSRTEETNENIHTMHDVSLRVRIAMHQKDQIFKRIAESFYQCLLPIMQEMMSKDTPDNQKEQMFLFGEELMKLGILDMTKQISFRYNDPVMMQQAVLEAVLERVDRAKDYELNKEQKKWMIMFLTEAKTELLDSPPAPNLKKSPEKEAEDASIAISGEIIKNIKEHGKTVYVFRRSLGANRSKNETANRASDWENPTLLNAIHTKLIQRLTEEKGKNSDIADKIQSVIDQINDVRKNYTDKAGKHPYEAITSQTE